MTASPRVGALRASLERGGWKVPLIIGIILRLAFILANEMDGGDWVSRTLRASGFVHAGSPIWARTPWPEGNYLLPAIPMSLGGDPYWSVRVFCALVSALAIPLIFAVGRQLGGRTAGMFAAWTLAILPFHVYISANGAMTEGPFLVFLLGAIAAAIHWVEQPSRIRWLLASALCVVGAEAFRFDGVFIGASIGFAALFVRNERGPVIRQPRIAGAIAAFGLIALAYPILLVISWQAIWGDPLHMVKVAEENATQFFGSGGHPRWPGWFYTAYSIGFWIFVGPMFALTPIIWGAAWTGVWRNRVRPAIWFLMLPLAVLTAFYIRGALAHTLLNQIRYVTAISIPLLACAGAFLAAVPSRTRRAVIGAALVFMAGTQAVTVDAAWHDRGVVSRQLSSYAVIRPQQHLAREVVRWINLHASPRQKTVFTPHASSAWLALADHGSVPLVRRLNIYRTPNLVYDRAGLVTALTDSLKSADWLVTSGARNTEGLQDGLVTELIQPERAAAGGDLVWHGVRMHLAKDFGRMRVYRVERSDTLERRPPVVRPVTARATGRR